MSYQEAFVASQKLTSFLELIARCQVTLSGAAAAEQNANALDERVRLATIATEQAERRRDEKLAEYEAAKEQASGEKSRVAAIVSDAEKQAESIVNAANAAAVETNRAALETRARLTNELELQRTDIRGLGMMIESRKAELAATQTKIDEALEAARQRFK